MSRIKIQTGDITRYGEHIVGDIGWIDYGGGFIVIDENGDPDLEMVEPLQSYDSKWFPAKWMVYRACLRPGEFDWADLESMSSTTGIPVEDLKTAMNSSDPKELAWFTWEVAQVFGYGEVDCYPLELDEKGVRARYPEESPTVNYPDD